MLLRLLRYRLNLKYVPGTKVCIADMLSRAHPSLEPLNEDSRDEEMELINGQSEDSAGAYLEPCHHHGKA